MAKYPMKSEFRIPNGQTRMYRVMHPVRFVIGAWDFIRAWVFGYFVISASVTTLKLSRP